ncbi:class I SAM-dependent methyltransferase [Gluconobacter albidus]|uniref:SAM-dependent methyltransferase n=1 Tax=Gluconobacter albidus TaxID=318683 RepID=A0A149TGC2_9PROT|nr:class I SAM-dependent methyltransferase [Gluconobacter albidus]KXV46717.1 hypothetical protein AD945_13140 [Gluconobacter albidus]MBS1027696.1 class I SAM-dependent methyltransferase [Gluconobacter albidus]
MSSGSLPFDPETLRYYAEASPSYVASGKGGQNRYLDRFLQKLESGAHILDLGCGGAIDARAMLEQGFSVEAVEASPSLAANAAQMLGKPVQVIRFDELQAADAYDAVWASASLIHVPRAALSGILAKVHAALKPGGWHLATYKSGGQEGRDSVGRYYNYPSAEEIRNFYELAACWRAISVECYTGGGFENGQGPWVMVEVRR